ncbi:MAG: sigma-54-dependent Fis family transcriptional regulator [Candidatus Eisenbacteria bacterium]|uniref:Sigma-54-dependent Fis family transcriptional regulator n=1 Tax=Eiseniibacteriota bacterium TaxID=2212470 RepID=A0A7Y2EC17_UNCEI|nr:sigma-54-dependent Fis family transcriptional regulator [Candidatus Eisenbacteria bacterium]
MAHEKVLIVDDEQSMCQFLSVLLKREGYEVLVADSGVKALKVVAEKNPDAIITDLNMPEMDGIELLENIKKNDETLPVIIMTAYASQQSAIDALNMGAFQYLEKSAKNDDIKLAVKNALQMRRVRTENSYLKRQLKKTHSTKEIIGKSESMLEVFTMVDKVAEAESTILISGESGTGKELIAREIHYRSRRANGPFVSINCGALPKELLESNLFGHMKGSFTGAFRDQMGLFQVAEGGTFFLDEIGEMQPDTQVKLLRALQEREIIPVGGTKPVKIDVRLVAATNADLEKAVREGRFRTDLFYRLNVIPLRLPSLRYRLDDVPILANHFLSRYLGPEGPKRLTKEALEVLMNYDWPGNVRELENIIERAVILCDGSLIDSRDLPEKVVRGDSAKGSLVIDKPDLTLEELEREYILKVLKFTGWQKKRASEILGINASTLYRKLQAYKGQGLLGDEILGADDEPMSEAA